MTATTTGSTVPRRQLGRRLRDLRNQARFTVRAAAKVLEWSEPKIWRIETGQTSLRSHDVETMCRVYGADAKLTEGLMGLAKETKARGWWHSYGDVIPENFDLYIGLEEAASHLSWYESELVPGLLQTDDYARTLIREDNRGVSEEEIERRVHVRIARQALLSRVTAAPTVDVALNEAVLRRPVGGQKIMEDQLDRLVHLNSLPNVSLRVVPYSAGLHAGMMSGAFVTMRFPVGADGRETEPPTVYVEGFTGALYLDKPNEIARYDGAFESIWGSAHDEAGSTSLLKQAARELGK
ncbi:helix-turn-helix domain-containing protein [Streptomyces sp. NBC_01498]|uniref:helix-turn-helix domain-containing protein n=1 Tax=Streptomyces sp. NBC_01498 TaxID=2975870 RepID=UPI002E7BDE3A|nr:helix-turn-helix transcriptional regulator [Streptomyces sp. NBC_01498]WTL26892.1 helix-turn-helix domain-containing protein [Streptomyces sp. NBC_01498]